MFLFSIPLSFAIGTLSPPSIPLTGIYSWFLTDTFRFSSDQHLHVQIDFFMRYFSTEGATTHPVLRESFPGMKNLDLLPEDIASLRALLTSNGVYHNRIATLKVEPSFAELYLLYPSITFFPRSYSRQKVSKTLRRPIQRENLPCPPTSN